MRKKQLIEQNTVLYNQVQELGIRNKQLEKEISKLRESLKPVPSESANPACQNTVNAQNVVKISVNDIKINDNIDYGSKVIGKIIVESAKAADKLVTDAGNRDVRELVNLVLGRTEVAKAEILKITASSSADDVKKSEIDKQYDEAVEYINSILAQ